MTSRERSLALNEWARPLYHQVRALRLAVLGLGLSLSLILASIDRREMLGERALIFGVAVSVLSTALTFSPGFKRFDAWMMVEIALLDLVAIGLFELIPNVEVVGALSVVPAMWLGGTLGRKGVAVAAGATALLVLAPNLLVHAPDLGWAPAVSTILFATLAAAGITLSTEMWTNQVRRLEEQGDELRSAINVKDDFVALVSHELRTPLSSIIGYLDLVTEGDEVIPDEARHHLAAVSRNADRLLLLVTDLLSTHQAGNAPMRLAMESVDVALLARLSLDDADQRAAEAWLTIVRDLPPGILISADPNRLLQILDNLLSNAIKFTPAGGHINVTLREQRTGVDLVVTDTGVGIDASSLQRLGAKFFRAPKTTKAAIPGLGLGLSITKTIVEAHHGSLAFTSTEGEGTSVLVHLPNGDPSAFPAAAQPAGDQPQVVTGRRG